jgi:hypothetical protein
VACRPVAKRWLRKQQPFLGNGSVNTFPLLGSRFLIMQQLDYNSGRAVFSTWSVPRSYEQGTKSVLYGRLWRKDFMCDILGVYFSETVTVPVLKSVAC